MVYVSKKLSHVGHHAMHNEYMALAEAGKYVVWLRQLLHELDHDYLIQSPTVLFGDNNAANSLTQEHFVSTGNQYIYLPYHAIKEWSDLGIIRVERKCSKHNLADLMTKNVTSSEIKMLLDRLCGYKTCDFDAHVTQLIERDGRFSELLRALVSQCVLT